MVTVVIMWIFINKIFNISMHAVVSLALELFELVLSNICLWLMFRFNKQTLYFDYVAATEQMCKDEIIIMAFNHFSI